MLLWLPSWLQGPLNRPCRLTSSFSLDSALLCYSQEPQLAFSSLPGDSELSTLVKSITEVTGSQEEHVLRVGRFLFARLFEGMHGR